MFGRSGACTLIVEPPSVYHEALLAIKKLYKSPKIPRSPYPHISLFLPFFGLDHLEEAAKLLGETLIPVKPFRCTLATMKLFDFGDKKPKVLYLEPTTDPPGALEALYQDLVKAFPAFASKRPFVPHLGLGSLRLSSKEAEAILETHQKEWTPVTFMVDHLTIKTRDPYDPTIDYSTWEEVYFGS